MRRRAWARASTARSPVAEQLGLSAFEVAHALERARARFRGVVLELIRESVVDEAAARRELEELFGRDPS